MFKMMTGLNLVHVPYRGAAPAMTDLLAGQVQVVFDNLPTSLEHIRAGKIRALAVTSRTLAGPAGRAGARRVRAGLRGQCLVRHRRSKGDAGRDRRRFSTRTVNAALADPALQARFAEMASAPIAMTPAQFGMLIADETEKWAKVIRFAGVSAADR